MAEHQQKRAQQQHPDHYNEHGQPGQAVGLLATQGMDQEGGKEQEVSEPLHPRPGLIRDKAHLLQRQS
ncbi:MAG: hypothetical protein K1566_03690 [Candidatus Thiodiazotropha sp. (ex. Lucinisca nassula)]|nr:hypothetical protein [Candidatus Thiodiazotropha sp. (ex. Lucinisca nassula)]MBW9268725.1 hypothetical protein [Candidatus Thiodiazotropha sp. (ex. Lucinisca nassula)]